ncbi:MAG: class I SAM-dependent methyltransferase [Actinomycetota bacterium]|nr:class I SAM-dependent methyltransferase [Actinomycetota bacterium]
MNVEEFVAAHLPEPPCRVLEIGCGAGELAHAIAQRGYSIMAIDPEAPAGTIFRRTSLEDFEEPEPFDVVVASRSLHHVHDLDAGLRKIHTLLWEGGLLILNEFAWELMDDRTARWYLSHVQEPGPQDESLLPGNFPDAWFEGHEGLHDTASIREELESLFQTKIIEWVPFIAEYYLERPDLIPQERDLIRSGEIAPLGLRYVGLPR